jgi:hypothetical protein
MSYATAACTWWGGTNSEYSGSVSIFGSIFPSGFHESHPSPRIKFVPRKRTILANPELYPLLLLRKQYCNQVSILDISSSVKLGTIINRNIEQLDQLRSLAYNWDGYGALPIKEESYIQALYLISKIEKNLYCIPTSSGNVQVELYTDHGSLEIEIGADKISVLIEKDEMIEEMVFSNIGQVLDRFGDFFNAA